MAFVQAVSNSNSASANTLSVTVTVAAGDTIVLYGVISSSGNPFGSFSTSKSDMVASVVSGATEGNGSQARGVIVSAVGGSTTFTITTSGANSNYMYIGVMEFSGRSGALSQDATPVYNTSFVTSHSALATPGNVTAGCDIVSLCTDDSSNTGTETFSPTGSWTMPAGGVQNASTGNYPPSMMMYQANVASATYTNTYTTSQATRSGNFIFGLPAQGNDLPASQGTYGYTGQAVTFSSSNFPPNLLAASGNYNLAGAPSSSDFQIVAAQSAYSYVGIPAQLVPVISPVSLIAGAGSYSIAAQNVSFTIGFQPSPPPANIGPILPVVFKVTSRTFNLLEMVEREWGASFREPDHRVYEFGGGKRFFDSTDMGYTGIYGPPGENEN